LVSNHRIRTSQWLVRTQVVISNRHPNHQRLVNLPSDLDLVPAADSANQTPSVTSASLLVVPRCQARIALQLAAEGCRRVRFPRTCNNTVAHHRWCAPPAREVLGQARPAVVHGVDGARSAEIPIRLPPQVVSRAMALTSDLRDLAMDLAACLWNLLLPSNCL
jgi:hypothetical protein